MARKPSLTFPKPIRHATGQAAVRVDGVDHYLGRYGTPQAEAEYRRLASIWYANGGRLPADAADPEAAPEPVTVREVLAAFLEHAKTGYLKNGRPTSEAGNVQRVVALVRERFADLPAEGFGPRALEECRAEMIRRGLTRDSINKNTSRIRSIFRYGVSRELVSPLVVTAPEAEFGIEVAQYVLGHSTPAMTRVFSDARVRRAAAAVGKSG
jgi:hypothetical protein